jgi:hypothetical protein
MKTANDYIGYGLRILKGPQPMYLGIPAPGKTPVKTFAAGQITPPIDSWVESGGKLYWSFQNPGGALSYYIEHKQPGFFKPVKYRQTDVTQNVPEPSGGATLPGVFDGMASILKAAPLIIGGLILFNLTRR